MDDQEALTVTTEIRDDRTVVTVSGSRDAAVVIESAAGERVYLPPEPTDEPGRSGDDGPYEGMSADSPYEGTSQRSPYEGMRADSPYEGMSAESSYGSPERAEARLGVTPTARGFRVVHPEPATDFRVISGADGQPV